MIRGFKTHYIREVEELSSSLWDFVPSDGEYALKQYKMLVPSCWESHPHFVNYRGKGIYTTKFYASGNVKLNFKGVSHTANVYVDDEFVGTHYNAFTPFSFICKNLTADEHTLKIEVDNDFSEQSLLHIPNDYMTYGGINRGVELETIGEIYIKRIHFSPFKEGDVWKAKVKVFIENLANDNLFVDLKLILDYNMFDVSDIEVAANKTLEVEEIFEFKDVEPWSMEEPNLYIISAFLEVEGDVFDDYVERVGFREITLDGDSILLNGKKIRIKGFNRHEDHAQFGCAIPYSAMVYDLELIKDMGANSIRTCHYPNDELFLDLCDEMGILVWEESHARGFEEEHMLKPNFDKQSEDCINEMVVEHFNHPSIYIWGVLNECASDTKAGSLIHKKQLEQLATLDNTRPNTFASNKHCRDLSFEYPTVISNNMYPLWYFDRSVLEMLSGLIAYSREHSTTLKPYIVSEIGCGGIYGSRNRTKEKWTEDGQADILEKQITPILENPDCTGVYIWQFCDIRVSTEWAMKRPRTHNNKGVVDEFRREKLAYYTVKKVFSNYGNYFDKN